MARTLAWPIRILQHFSHYSFSSTALLIGIIFAPSERKYFFPLQGIRSLDLPLNYTDMADKFFETVLPNIIVRMIIFGYLKN
jgi:hypothetical protein